MYVWLQRKNKALDEEAERHAKFLEEWETMHSNPDLIYTLVISDRADIEFKELRDELDKQDIDYKVVSAWVDPREQEEE
jgi:hypothetical protein